ncbi:hypothetical protein [Actinomadura rupiterrae]|uniref:hypothetical protein n=1 Tax=Actinomadura rupiterrae TaxID=559627 RepID=UPI0020A23D7B|nr:hypothetical protein [Actinomadura rupiterrae]MCP2336133.1 hypothetical protein [Actinomadura rupiterrae]
MIDWAVRTGRIMASRRDFYRKEIKAGRVTEVDVEDLASVLDPSEPDGQVEASPGRHAASARNAHVVSAFAGDPAGELLAEATRGDHAYRDASRVSAPPELFPGSGVLPLATASGLDPRVMSGAPWWTRPAIAEAETLPEALELLQDASSAEGIAAHTLDGRFAEARGLRDFYARVERWAVAGGAAAGERARDAAVAARRAIAAAAKPVEERAADELYDEIFGSADRRRAELRAF